MLRLDYDALADAASKLRTEGDTFEGCVETMTNVINGLTEIWEAETCNQYVDQYTDAKKTLDDVRALIEDMATQMESISRNFAQADADMKSQM